MTQPQTSEEKRVLETEKTLVSMVVTLKDEFSKQQPVGSINVSLKGESNKPKKNPSGHYVFLNLPTHPNTYTIQVTSDYYFDQTQTKDLTPLTDDMTLLEKIDALKKEITLQPTPAYPFPNGTTLIRGTVTDQTGNPIGNAKVKVVKNDLEFLTTDKGEFVIYFRQFVYNGKDEGANADSDLLEEDGRRFVKPDRSSNTKELKIKATLNKKSSTQIIAEGVEEGTCATVSAIKLNTTS